MNWRRGLHRAFLVFSVGWVLLVLVVFPFREVSKAREFAAQNAALSSQYGPASSVARAESERLQAQLWADATLSAFYRKQVIPHWPLVLGVVLVPPAVLYALARAIIAVALWVGQGFKPPPAAA